MLTTAADNKFDPNRIEMSNAVSEQIHNQVTGERMRVLRLPDARRGAALRLEFVVPPTSNGAPLHYHRRFVERFEILHGQLEMQLGNKKPKRILRAGEIHTVAPNELHGFSNPFAQNATFTVETGGDRDFEFFVRGMYGLANDNQTTRDGLPLNPLHVAVLFELGDLYFPFVPGWLQKSARRAAVRVAESTGSVAALEPYFKPTNLK